MVISIFQINFQMNIEIRHNKKMIKIIFSYESNKMFLIQYLMSTYESVSI